MRAGLAALIAALIVASTGGARAASPTTSPSDAYPVPVQTTEAQNEEAAAAEADGLVVALDQALTSLNVGAVRHRTAPVAAVKKPDEFTLGGDPSLSRTAWWTVKASPRTLSKRLTAHPPAGTTAPKGPRWGGGSVTNKRHHEIRYLFGIFGSPSTQSYTPGELDIEAVKTTTGSALIAVTYLSARLARGAGSFVTDPVSSIDIVAHTTGRDLKTGAPIDRTTQSSITDADAIDAAVTALNALPAVAAHGFAHSCPYQPTTTSFVVTLHSDVGDVVVRASSMDLICGNGGLSIERDGVAQDPQLDGDDLPEPLSSIFSRADG